MPRAQTLKQAKAAYKSRNGNMLTEREKKQLERGLELERRAWRAREAEKRKAEARAKREAKEERQRKEGVAAGMTSQRRCDKFGFVGSQMHLGAFFGGEVASAGRHATRQRREAETALVDVVEDCFDDELDDDTLLEAEDQHSTRPTAESSKPAMLSRRNAAANSSSPTAPAASDLDSFWADLDSSTQIARDLEEGHANSAAKPPSPNTSFGSGDFDLSVEDIEKAQMNEYKQYRERTDRDLMPPPALPSKPSLAKAAPKYHTVPEAPPPKPAPTKIGPGRSSLSRTPAAPALPSKMAVRHPYPRPPPLAIAVQHSVPPPKPVFAPHSGFTMAELESYVDDDLQLTQVDPV